MISPLQQIEGKYETLSKLGEGGMGSVYKVRHRLLDEIRVIKIMRSSIAEEEDARARFLREARSASRVRHPNVAQLYDFSVDPDGTSYIVMEFVEGVTLDEVLRRRGRTSVALALEIAIHSLRALDCLHHEQLVHRDIAPDNLMLTRDQAGRPFVKLIDLGIAKSLESEHTLTEKGLFVGKMRYASPEQFGGSEGGATVDARSDLYSFGIVLYELLTGVYPIAGSDFQTLIAGHLFRPPRPFDESDPESRVPARLREAVLKALAKDVAERHASAASFGHELEAIAKGQESGSSADPVAETAFILQSLKGKRAEIEARPGSTQDRLDYRFGVADPTGPPGSTESEATVDDDSATRLLESAAREAKAAAAAAQARRERLAILLGEGRDLLTAGELDEAQARAEQALALDPEATGALSLSRQIDHARRGAKLAQAEELLARGELEAARGLVDPLLEEASGDTRAQALLEQIRQQQQARERAQHHESLLAEARHRLKGGDFRGARAQADAVLEEVPDHEAALSLRRAISDAHHAAVVEEGQGLLEQGELTRAQELARRVLDETPTDPGAQRLLEQVEARRQQAEEVVAEARELLEAGQPDAAHQRLEALPADNRRHREVRQLEKQIARAAEQAHKAEAARQARELRQREQELRRREDAERREESRRQEAARRAEEAARQQQALQAEAARRAEDARRAEAARAGEAEGMGKDRQRSEPARRVQEAEGGNQGLGFDRVSVGPAAAATVAKSVEAHSRSLESAEPELARRPEEPTPVPSGTRRWLPVVGMAAGVLALGTLALVLFLGRADPSTEPTAPAPPAAAAHLLIDAIPWGEVVHLLDEGGEELPIDGDRHTPLTLAVAPGVYTVILHHPAFGQQTCAPVAVEPGGTGPCLARFESVDLERYFQEAGW